MTTKEREKSAARNACHRSKMLSQTRNATANPITPKMTASSGITQFALGSAVSYYVTGFRRDPSDGEIRRFNLTVAGDWSSNSTSAELFTRLTLAQQRMDQFKGSYVARSI